MGVHDIKAYGMSRMCLKKRKYRTLEYAEEQAKKYEKMFGKPQHAYYCPLCGCYHLTTKEV